MLEMAGQPVICVGGGPVAAAKLRSFADAGAAVVVISPTVEPQIADLAGSVLRREYRTGDLDAAPLPRFVIAATGDASVDEAVARDAARLGIWCLRVDGGGARGRSEVAVPAVIRQDPMVVAVTTGAPALSRRVREEVEQAVAERWGPASTILAALREDQEVRRALDGVAPDIRRARWRSAVDAVLDPADAAVDRAAAARRILTGG